MKRYVIEREIPGVDKMGQNDLSGAAKTSNAALAQLAAKVRWLLAKGGGLRTTSAPVILFPRDNTPNHMIHAPPIRRRVVKTFEINRQMPAPVAYRDLRQEHYSRRDLSV